MTIWLSIYLCFCLVKPEVQIFNSSLKKLKNELFEHMFNENIKNNSF